MKGFSKIQLYPISSSAPHPQSLLGNIPDLFSNSISIDNTLKSTPQNIVKGAFQSKSQNFFTSFDNTPSPHHIYLRLNLNSPGTSIGVSEYHGVFIEGYIVDHTAQQNEPSISFKQTFFAAPHGEGSVFYNDNFESDIEFEIITSPSLEPAIVDLSSFNTNVIWDYSTKEVIFGWDYPVGNFGNSTFTKGIYTLI